MALTAKVDTSVAMEIARTTVNAPRMARPPMSTGRLAATTPPKMTMSRSSTKGIAIISPLVTSDLVRSSIRTLTATVPPTCVSRPGTVNCGLIALYSACLPLSSSAVSRITRYVACPSRDTSPGTPS